MYWCALIQPDTADEKLVASYNTEFCPISSENNAQLTVDESSFVRPSLLKPVVVPKES